MLSFALATLRLICEAQKHNKIEVVMKYHIHTASVLRFLLARRLINGFYTFEKRNNFFFRVHLKYSSNGTPAIRIVKTVSKQGYICPITLTQLPYKNISRTGLFVLETSRGLLTDLEALTYRLSGRIIFFLA